MVFLRRTGRRLALAYQVRCAREDARIRHLATPVGVWVCHICEGVSLTQRSFSAHLVAAHA